MPRRSYRQHCALARALDVIGERWTLLVVRELLIGPRRYSELLEHLPGMGTNLLAARLKDLQAADLIERVGAHYDLTARGRELEEAVLALCRFGAPYLAEWDSEHLWTAGWNALALKYAFDPDRGRDLDGVVEIRVGEDVVQARLSGGEIDTAAPGSWEPDVSMTTDAETFLAVASGELSLEEALDSDRAVVTGDGHLLAQVASALRLPVEGAP